MPQSNHRLPYARRPAAGTVTVIEARVHRSFARNAKLAFYCTLTTVALLTATVAADRIHPILALLLGVTLGLLTGIAAWALVRSWPVLRLLWWWTPEIGLALAVVYGWTALARHTQPLTRLAVLTLLVGVPAAIPPIRRRVVALAWCLIVRHRLRVCFAEFIIANRGGTLPLILWAWPTPVGERVWIYLRPGLSLHDLESRLDKLAVACHAATVIAEPALQRTAALLRLDVKRRDVLTDTVGSPLLGLVDPDTPPALRPVFDPPTALDLPDVAADPATGTPATPRTDVRKAAPAPAPAHMKATPPAPATATVGAAADDITDWI